jgi:peptidoglycan/LPS O-acetylase OafA/YrhL
VKKLAVINGLRGYAILGVIYFHLLGVFFNQPGWVTEHIGSLAVFPLTFLGHGWLGVDLFFILSGFVLYLPYAAKSRTLANKQDVWNFYKSRAARLLPLYYTVLLVSVIFVAHWINIHDAIFWRTMLLLFTCTFNFTKETFIPQCNYVLWNLVCGYFISVLLLGWFPVGFLNTI